MSGPSDTSPEAQRVLDEVHRSMPAWRKWHLLDDLYRFGRELHSAGARSRRPGATAAQIRDDWFRHELGLLPEAFPVQDPPAVSHSSERLASVEQVTEALDRLGIAYAIGGSVASSIHGINRNTIDAGLCVEPFPDRETLFTDQFGPDFYINRDTVRAAMRDRSSFDIIQTTTGFKVDVFVRKDRPFERSVLARRRAIQPEEGSSRPVFVVSAEDVVLLKLESYRLGNGISDRQRSDVLGVLRVQAGRLDEAYLDRWAVDLGVSDLLARARAEAAPAA